MNVLLIGSGGREHAIAWKLSQSPLLTKLFIAPGNAGTALCGINVPIAMDNFPALAQLVRSEKIKLVVVGPEDPLVKGISDYFKEQDDLRWVGVIGPSAAGARLEGSKDFAKQFMEKFGIPTARYSTFTLGKGNDSIEEASAFIGSMQPPYVLKADGLAAGKGVVILNDPEEAISELREMFAGKFGSAGKKVVIEEFLDGIELSVFILTDGDSWLLLPEAKDYKRIGERDTGLNTGGMGAVSPVAFANPAFMEKVKARIIEPTIKGLQVSGIRYQGFIFFGLINVKGEPFVIEYNVRLGDPESEVVIPRIKSDLLELFIATADGRLNGKQIEISGESATTVMLVSGGYPGDYQKGFPISGLETDTDGIVFHAGTAILEKQMVTNGGRVLALTSLDTTWKKALKKSYKTAKGITFEGVYYRRDIGFDL
ncbi:MAG: phosphoribosylamine--glycine ligase [Porphyromonadaceae bacterium]|nr:MAG: phosphoribosylamine--glycine ligase [Porphyromonadaceae bacterium]